MKILKSCLSDNNYFCIQFNGTVFQDYELAKILGIDYDTFIEIIVKYGAHKIRRVEYWFYTKEEVEAAILELEPYYILTKLTTGN